MTLFLRNVLTLTVSVALCSILSISLNTFSTVISPDWFYGIAFLTGLSFVLNLLYAQKAGTESMTELLLAGVVIKLLLSLTCILIYSVMKNQYFFGFSLQFIMHYILFTIFEIRYLLHIIKTHPLKRT